MADLDGHDVPESYSGKGLLAEADIPVCLNPAEHARRLTINGACAIPLRGLELSTLPSPSNSNRDTAHQNGTSPAAKGVRSLSLQSSLALKILLRNGATSPAKDQYSRELSGQSFDSGISSLTSCSSTPSIIYINRSKSFKGWTSKQLSEISNRLDELGEIAHVECAEVNYCPENISKRPHEAQPAVMAQQSRPLSRWNIPGSSLASGIMQSLTLGRNHSHEYSPPIATQNTGRRLFPFFRHRKAQVSPLD